MTEKLLEFKKIPGKPDEEARYSKKVEITEVRTMVIDRGMAAQSKTKLEQHLKELNADLKRMDDEDKKAPK